MTDQTQSNSPAPSQQGPSQQAAGASPTSASTSPLCDVEVSNSPISPSDLQQHIQLLALSLGRGAPHTQLPNVLPTSVQMRPGTPSLNPLQYNAPIPVTAQRDTQNAFDFDAPTAAAHTPTSGSAPWIATTQAPAHTQSSVEPRAPTKTEHIEKAVTPPDKSSVYGWGTHKHEATAKAETAQPKEQSATSPSTEQSLLTTQTPTHALEKALETMLRGTSSDPFRPAPEYPPMREAHITQPLMGDISRDPNPQLHKASSIDTATLQGTEQAPRDVTSLNQPRADNVGYINSLSERSIEQPPRDTSAQTLEQHSEQRSDQIRVLQQIGAAEFAPPTRVSQHGMVDTLRTSLESTPSIHPRHESTTVSVQTLREGLLSKFEAIQSQIHTSATERQSLEQHRYAPVASQAHGRSDFLKTTPIRHDATPLTHTQLADRSGSPPSIAKILTEAPRTISHLIAPGASILHRNATPLEHSHAAHTKTDSLERLIGLLKKFSKRSTNFELMKRMDSTLEQTCLSLVTVIALGVVGIEVMMRLAHAALVALLRELREKQEKEAALSDLEQELETELAAELDAYLAQVLRDDDTVTSVVDVSGIIISKETLEPLPGILIGSRELGSTVSDGDGSFLFRNIAYGVPYSLSLYKGSFQVNPNTVHGVSGEASMHRIEVTLTPTRPR